MRCTEVLKTSVSPEIKLQAKVIADREFLSEATWLKRLMRVASRNFLTICLKQFLTFARSVLPTADIFG
jgi:hypothetical protein